MTVHSKMGRWLQGTLLLLLLLDVRVIVFLLIILVTFENEIGSFAALLYHTDTIWAYLHHRIVGSLSGFPQKSLEDNSVVTLLRIL